MELTTNQNVGFVQRKKKEYIYITNSYVFWMLLHIYGKNSTHVGVL